MPSLEGAQVEPDDPDFSSSVLAEMERTIRPQWARFPQFWPPQTVKPNHGLIALMSQGRWTCQQHVPTRSGLISAHLRFRAAQVNWH